MNWRWADNEHRVVIRDNADGSQDSRGIHDAEVQDWLNHGNIPSEPSADLPPAPTQQGTVKF